MSEQSFSILGHQGPQLASDIAVRGYFPTPVAVTMLAHHDVLQRDLNGLIEERSRVVPPRADLAPGLWQSEDDVPAWGGKSARMVLDVALGLAQRLTADRQGQPISPSWRLAASALIRRPGAVWPGRSYPFAHWLAIYQIDDGLGGTDEPATPLLIDDPRGQIPLLAAPQTGYAMPGAHRPGEPEKLVLNRGQIVLMPGWLRVAMAAHSGSRPASALIITLTP
jgi:hypothetical protein